MAEIEAHESKIYSEFAPLYDKIFGKIFYSRLERVIEDLEIPPGAKVLEVGAGTGTSFPAYPTHCEVIGIDLAPLRGQCGDLGSGIGQDLGPLLVDQRLVEPPEPHAPRQVVPWLERGEEGIAGHEHLHGAREAGSDDQGGHDRAQLDDELGQAAPAAAPRLV